MYSVALGRHPDTPWLAMEPIRVGRTSTTANEADKVFVVCAEDRPFARVDLYQHRDDYHGFEAHAIWSHYLVIGSGHRVHFIDLRDRSTSEFELDSYFGNLSAGETRLLVASAQRLFSFDRDGVLEWRSAMLGIDGVVVESVTATEIVGCGEWDPPGGWQSFRLSASNGVEILDPA